MAACSEFETLIIDRAAGALEDLDRDRLEQHLAGCDACRAELRQTEQLLGFATLPPVPLEELERLKPMPEQVLTTFRRTERRERWLRRSSLASLAVAAAALLVLAPFRGPKHPNHAAALKPAPVPAQTADVGDGSDDDEGAIEASSEGLSDDESDDSEAMNDVPDPDLDDVDLPLAD